MFRKPQAGAGAFGGDGPEHERACELGVIVRALPVTVRGSRLRCCWEWTMVLGVGVDVIEVERMQGVLDRHGGSFLRHVFLPEEQQDAPTGAGRPAYYAGRWAAKEAVAKALGTGIGAACGWTDIHITRDEGGRPTVGLRGAGASTAEGIGIRHIHISISHERRIACACAVAEGELT